MKICITNDDGIHSEGLRRLVQWAKQLGEVSVFAPLVEQSAKSHAVELRKAYQVKAMEVPGAVKAYAVDSTPADCLRIAILGLHEQFDLVISGINRGLNLGQDILYSGTVSAAMEAVALGCKGLAISTEPETFDAALAHLDRVWAFICENRLFDHARLWNVNIPVRTTGVIRITRQGGPYYSDEFLPEENDMYRPRGKDVFQPTAYADFDTDCTLHDRDISITPLTIDRTDWQAFRLLKS